MGDWLKATAQLEGVRSIALFQETDGDGGTLAEALAECADNGIRVAVLKVGSSDAGGRAAAAHAGPSGDQRVFRALIEEAGAAWPRIHRSCSSLPACCRSTGRDRAPAAPLY